MDQTKVKEVLPPVVTVKKLLQHGASTVTGDKITFSAETTKAVTAVSPLFVNYISTLALDHFNHKNSTKSVKRKAPGAGEFYEAVDDTEVLFLRTQIALRTQSIKRARWLQDGKKKANEPAKPTTTTKKSKNSKSGDKNVDFSKLESEDEESEDEEEQDDEEEEEEEEINENKSLTSKKAKDIIKKLRKIATLIKYT